jgi:hypothetical protein
VITGVAATLLEVVILVVFLALAILATRRADKFSKLGPAAAFLLVWLLAIGTLIHDTREAIFILQLRAISGQQVRSVKIGENALPSNILTDLRDSALLMFTNKRMRSKPVQMTIEKLDGSRLALNVAREGQGVRIENGGLSAYSNSLRAGLVRQGVDLPEE